jgi:hypothetical protein
MPAWRCCQNHKADSHKSFRNNDLETGDLGFEPSREALRRYWSDVANALLCLRMRKNHTTNTLNQYWARMGNTFPYFSPDPLSRSHRPVELRILALIRSNTALRDRALMTKLWALPILDWLE